MDIKVGDKIELLINDEVIKAKVYSISTRETFVDIETYCTFDLEDNYKSYSLSLSKIEYKKDIDNMKK